MRAIIISLVVLPLACSGEPPQTATITATEIGGGQTVRASAPPPSIEEAKAIVASSPEFSEYQFTHAAYTLPMQQSAMTAPGRDIAARLAKAKWIGIDGDGRVVLTQKAQNDKRFLVRPNGVVDIVPLARKELQDVAAVRMNPEGQPVVDFRWKWIPNEIGALFDERYSGQQQASATLYRDGSGWGVLRIRPAEKRIEN